MLVNIDNISEKKIYIYNIIFVSVDLQTIVPESYRPMCISLGTSQVSSCIHLHLLNIKCCRVIFYSIRLFFKIGSCLAHKSLSQG